MSNQYTAVGKLVSRSETQQITDSFKKREFVIEVEDGAYAQFVKFQLTQDKCEKIAGFKKGDLVEVAFNLRGRAYEKEGKTLYFTNLEAWKVEARENRHTPNPPQQQNQPAPQSQPVAAGDDDLPF